MEEIYSQLAKHLNTLPIPFPSTESGIELKILKRWFSLEEARIALNMAGFPEQDSVIAQRLHTPLDTLAPKLEVMSQKGLIFRVVKGDQRYYNIVPLAEGMWEFHLNSIEKEDIDMLHEYMEIFMEKAWYGNETTQHRIIPISKSISADMEIMPYEQAEAIIKSQSKISVAHCICRKEHAILGQPCDHPSEVCMAFGTGAYYYLENGLGREVTQEQALGILNKAMDAGLVLQPGNGQKAWSLCMCCGCACYLLKSLKKMDKPAQVAHTNFYAHADEVNCTACGICEERCPMEAITIETAAFVNTDRCIGCGVCVGSCEFDAMMLIQKDESERYQPPENVSQMQVQIAKERGIV